MLDGLRGLAALAVIADHVESSVIMRLTPSRADAVDFFFVLSGFVLAHAYQERLLNRQMSAGGFLLRRLIRFYPLYLLGFVAGLGAFLVSLSGGWVEATGGEVAVAAVAGAAFLPAPGTDWAGNMLFPFNGPSWSLFYELVVNVLFAACIGFLRWRTMLVALPVLAVALLFSVTRQAVPGPGWTWGHVDAGLARVCFCFLAGVAVYRFREIYRLPRVHYAVVFLALLAVFWGPVPDGWRNEYDALAAILVMPVLVALGAECRVDGIAAGLFTKLGAYSFGVYILHVPLLDWLRIVFGFLGVSIPGDLLVFVLAALAMIAAAIASRWIDRPMRAALSDMLVRRTSQAGP